MKSEMKRECVRDIPILKGVGEGELNCDTNPRNF